jgi:release factor glutamine methyltransferase
MRAAAQTVATVRHALTEQLRQAGVESADADARLLIGRALGIDRAEMIADGSRPVTAQDRLTLDAMTERRIGREPVSRILGRKEFWSLVLNVTPDVLVPRPETETVVEAALDFVMRGNLRMETLRILDIGTGSGALLLALLSELPNAIGTGTDISAKALAVARDNADLHRLAGRSNFVECDIAAGLPGPFDLIVSNPPYIAHGDIAGLDPEVRDFDPAVALDGGADGLDGYRAIAQEARRLLAPGGRLIVELGAGREAAVAALFSNAGLTPGTARDDLASIPRALDASVAS